MLKTSRQPETLAALLGGRSGAIDATIPPVGFALGWLLSRGGIEVGAAVALTTALAVAGWRFKNGAKPRAVLISALAVCLSVMAVLITGRAADFFLIQIVSNAASALAWTFSIAIHRPLLGLIVGFTLRQKTRWRRDPDLLRGYSRASWIWVAQYALRLTIFIPLWMSHQVVGLTIARVALTWPLIALCLAASWWVLRRSLPTDHPGIRHPVLPPTAAELAIPADLSHPGALKARP